MQKYNPVEYNRTIWYDQIRTKNHPKKCKESHRFCSLDYQWSDNTATLQHMNRPINATIPNITLPQNTEYISTKYQNLTEQHLDDWVAQSMNRTINSMLNPNKKYFIPPTLDEELKIRYRKQRKNLKVQPDDTYFKTRNLSSTQRSYLSHKKSKTIDISDLIVDYKKLQPKQIIGKSLIAERQQRNHPPKQETRRRNAILLDKDFHYERFMQQKKTSDPESAFNINAQRKVIESLNKNKIFTLNYESLKRKNLNDRAPCSITQYDGIKIELPAQKFTLDKNNNKELRKQQEQQQHYRLKGNAQAQQAYSIMENFSTTKTRRTFRTKVSFSEEKSQHDRQKMFSTVSLLEPTVRMATHKTEKKLHKEQTKQGLLGKKVIKLLQDMHVESQNINIAMIKFQLHPQIIELTRLDSNNIAHKWIRKAQQQLALHHDQTAFECYKQAIISDPQLFNPVYNFATLLQRQNRYQCSLQWFKLAKEFDSDNERVTFAISIINVKMERFQDSFKEINFLINYLLAEKKKVDIRYYYLRAICNKKFGKCDAAKKDYRLVLEQSRAHNYDDLGMFIFSNIFAKKRRFVPHVSCQAYTKIHQLAYFSLYEKGPMLVNESDMNTGLAEKIKDFPFFKRFPPQLVQRLVKLSVYEYHQANQVIFIKPEQCIILLDGLMVIKNHQKNVFVHEITYLLKQGDFVGANSLDNNRNSNLNNWYYTHTHVELLRVKSLDFESVWKGQITIDLDEKYNKLKNNLLFSGLSEAILFKLCEVMTVKKMCQGEIIFNDGSYRAKTANKTGCGFSLLYTSLVDSLDTTKNNSNNQKTHKQGFNQMKFSGLYIVKSGQVQIQDDKGFSNSDIICQNNFFGQNLILDSDGFQNYGRLIVASDEAEFYVLEPKDLIWFFSQQDKEVMLRNCRNLDKRKSLQLVRDLRKRYHQYLDVRQKFKVVSD